MLKACHNVISNTNVDTVDTVETVDTVGSVESVDTLETVETLYTAESVNDLIDLSVDETLLTELASLSPILPSYGVNLFDSLLPSGFSSIQCQYPVLLCMCQCQYPVPSL